MATGDLLLVKGSAVTFDNNGGTVGFTVEGLTNGAGRVSAQYDLGAAPRAAFFTWSAECQFQATPTQGKGLELYIAGAPDGTNTQIDGDIGTTNAAMGDVDMRRNLKGIGYIVSENAAASEKCNTSGRFTHTERYISIAAYNDSGASVNATASNWKFVLTPWYWQTQ